MRRFQWNALELGDRVRVHEGSGRELTGGTVEIVDVLRGSNGVGIRVVGQQAGIVWPSRPTVHLENLDPAEHCWRCESVAVG
jgi:hypothetical protein